MVTFDLDARVEEVEETVRPQVTSNFLCPLGARPAALHASLPSVLTAAASLLAASS